MDTQLRVAAGELLQDPGGHPAVVRAVAEDRRVIDHDKFNHAPMAGGQRPSDRIGPVPEPCDHLPDMLTGLR